MFHNFHQFNVLKLQMTCLIVEGKHAVLFKILMKEKVFYNTIVFHFVVAAAYYFNRSISRFTISLYVPYKTRTVSRRLVQKK